MLVLTTLLVTGCSTVQEILEPEPPQGTNNEFHTVLPPSDGPGVHLDVTDGLPVGFPADIPLVEKKYVSDSYSTTNTGDSLGWVIAVPSMVGVEQIRSQMVTIGYLEIGDSSNKEMAIFKGPVYRIAISATQMSGTQVLVYNIVELGEEPVRSEEPAETSQGNTEQED